MFCGFTIISFIVFFFWSCLIRRQKGKGVSYPSKIMHQQSSQPCSGRVPKCIIRNSHFYLWVIEPKVSCFKRKGLCIFATPMTLFSFFFLFIIKDKQKNFLWYRLLILDISFIRMAGKNGNMFCNTPLTRPSCSVLPDRLLSTKTNLQSSLSHELFMFTNL